MQYELLKKRIGPASDQLRPTDRTKSAKGIGSGHLEHQTLVLYCPSSEPPLFAADSQEWQPLTLESTTHFSTGSNRPL
jgi:hypothetical protein